MDFLKPQSVQPNFVIGGGVASGTSFLSHSIKDHPQIYLPRKMRPECAFFYKSWEYAKGLNYYLEKWFHEVKKNHIAIGERSSLYLHGNFNKVAERVHQHYPEMKFIFCLRNPTERAYANYRFTALSGLETLPFEKALKVEEKRIKSHRGIWKEIRPNSYLERGLYYNQLKPFFNFFPKNNILCIKSEAMSKDPVKTFREVFRFLGVNIDYQPPVEGVFSSPNIKNLYYQALLRKFLGRKLDIITENFRKERLHSLAEKIVGINLTAQKMPMEEKTKKTLDKFYAPHNQKLSKLLNWDISDW